MRTFVSLAAAAALAAGVSIGAQSAQAVPFGFDILEANGGPDISSQLLVDVLEFGSDQVTFNFQNLDLATSVASSITDIYFHDMNGDILVPPLQISGQSTGVSFSLGASPGNLSGGQNASPPFVATGGLTMDSDAGDPGVMTNGINPGEWLLVLADAFTDFDSVIAGLISGDLRIGLRIQGMADDVSQSYINNPTPIPLPAGLLLFLSGLAGIGFLGRYKARRRETAAA